MEYEVFSFSFKNPDRMRRMAHRFYTVGAQLTWVAPVPSTDKRIPESIVHKRPHSIMLNHLDMLSHFVHNSRAEFGVFCEDDIYIRRSFANDIKYAMDAYKRNGLDVLLLGYLAPYKPVQVNINPAHSAYEPAFHILSYNDDLWGSQMYMMDKAGARKALEKYTTPEAALDPYFSPDWTLTKFGKRALLYPLLAVEEGHTATDHVGQQEFHRRCTDTHYDPALFF
jgi:hypothetical protein